MGTVVWIAGAFVEREDAKVSLLDRGYMVGAGVFATMRAYEGRCFRTARHLAELARAAELFGLNVPDGPGATARLADEAARRTGAANARVRVTLSDTAFSILAEELVLPGADVAAVTVTPRRIPPACFDGTAKTTSYAAQVLAQREATLQGAGEGLQLALDGSVACGTMSNVFVIRGDELATPSLASGCRAGVTREAVLALAPSVGLRPTERVIAVDELTRADEAFFTSTRIECLPIATLDGAPIGEGSFPRTRALLAAFQALVRTELGG